MKTEYLFELGGMAVASLIGGIVGAIISRKKTIERVDKEISREKLRLKVALDDAKESVKDISEMVDNAVRFVYDTEAKDAFDRRLKKLDIESVAVNECKTAIKPLEDKVLSKMFREEYLGSVHKVVQDELVSYFRDNIKKITVDLIDDDFIKKTAKHAVNDAVESAVETEVRDAVDEFDLDTFFENYFDDSRSFKKDYKKAIENYLDDNLKDLVDELVEEAKNEH